jgi:CBS-domain-containing membrane protein
MNTKTAGDIMIPLDQYPHIPYWFTLRQAIAELEKSVLEINGRQSLPRGLLVFDEKYQLMGVARRRDILRGLEPKFLGKREHRHERVMFEVDIDPNLADLSFGREVEVLREQSQRQIGEVMTPIAATADYADSLTKVIATMLSHDLTMLPVTKDGKVVGVVRSVDVFHEVANLLL